MHKSKINIQFPFGKYGGGGNTFLNALRRELQKMDLYESFPENADAILFNSHHELDRILKLRKKFSEKFFIHRVDGPIFKVRGTGAEIDKEIYRINNKVADGTVFQSEWSRKENAKLGLIKNKYETVIYNASNEKMFNREGREGPKSGKKIKLINTSNSANWRKGFELYKYLDENLDFSKFEMTFIGNSPAEFKNINWIKWIEHKKMPEILKKHDMYITACENEPCSNSLVEGLSCGLPVVALDNGCHPELIKGGGLLFKGRDDVIEKIEEVANNIDYFASRIPRLSMKKATKEYLSFIKKIYKEVQEGKYVPKKVSWIDGLITQGLILKRKILKHLK